MRDVRRGALTAVAGVTVLALAGCGAVDSVRYPYAKESADAIFLDSVKATTALKSVRISGYVDLSQGPRMNFNLLDAENGSCGGTVSFSTADFDVVTTPEKSYMKGSVASWQQLPGVSREEAIVVGPILADRWVDTTSGGSARAEINPLCRLVDELLTPAEQEAVDAGKVPDTLEVTNKGLSEAAGVKAVKLEVVDEKSASDIWVALDVPHYILKFAEQNKKADAEVVLSDFNFGGEVALPEKKEILDPSKLTAKDYAARSG